MKPNQPVRHRRAAQTGERVGERESTRRVDRDFRYQYSRPHFCISPQLFDLLLPERMSSKIFSQSGRELSKSSAKKRGQAVSLSGKSNIGGLTVKP